MSVRDSGDVGSLIGGAGAHNYIDGVGTSIDNFAKQAAAGDISVDAEGGAALLQFATAVQDWYHEHLHNVTSSHHPPQLGGSVAAKVVSPFMVDVGGDEHGYLTQMRKLAERMEQFKAGVNKAMETYQTNEHDVAGGLKP